jgi:hypothetical protein
MRAVISLIALALVSKAAWADDNWPQFRGPHGDGHADAKSLPLRPRTPGLQQYR